MFSKDQLDQAQSRYSIRFIKTNCSVIDAEDKSLPRDSYLITSIAYSGDVWYDIVQGLRSNIFDAYHDNFPNCIRGMEWTEGTVNPKLWGAQKKAGK